MSVPSFFKRLIAKARPAAPIKVAPTDTQKLVAVLLTLPIAADARDAILSLVGDSYSGRQKADIVVGKTLPALAELIAARGMQLPASDIEDLARELVQTLYNQIASPRATLVARLLLTLFGVL